MGVKNTNNKYNLLIFVFLGFLTVSGFVIFSIYFFNPEPVNNIINTNETPVDEPAQFNEWLSYTDYENKFSFKYPQGYVLNESEQKGKFGIYKKVDIYIPENMQSKYPLSKNPQFVLRVEDNEERLSLYGYYQKLCEGDLTGECIYPFEGENTSYMNLQSGELVYYAKNQYCVTGCTKAALLHEDKIYSFVNYYHGVPEQEEIFDKLILSLDFI